MLFSQKINDSNDSVKTWCGIQPIEKGDEKDFVEKTQLFTDYNIYCDEEKIDMKKRDGKRSFYKKFQKFFEVDEANQIQYRDNNTEYRKYCYRGIKRIDSTINKNE